MSKDDFFIGWSPDTPKPDRRAFMAGGLVLTLGAAGGAALLASNQNPPGPGTWNQGDVRTFTGIATAAPYAMLRTTDVDGTPKTVPLACLGKCGVTARIGSYAGQSVSIKGSLIQRGPYAMIAVIDGMDWITASDTPSDLAFPGVESLGAVSLKGMVVDTKCWFGAMRPSTGKVHKSCAALCIRGGLPPAFLAKDKRGREALMIMTNSGGPHGDDLLPLVADPVEIHADLKRWGDVYLLDGPVDGIQRIA